VKILIILFFVFSVSYAKVYYAKVEPFEIRDISSNVSGYVTYINEDLVGVKDSKNVYLRIDSELDTKELIYINDKLNYLKKTINVNEKILENLSSSLEKKRENYKKVISLKFKSSVEKDREYYDLISNENLNLNTQKEIQNLKVQITDLKFRKAQLEKNIKDKVLSTDGMVLYSILVKPGQVVGISTPLAKLADTSKAILTIYLDEVDVDAAKDKIIYIDGEKTSYKISRVLTIADTKNISKYMAQIVMTSPKLFSKLVKVELVKEPRSE